MRRLLSKSLWSDAQAWGWLALVLMCTCPAWKMHSQQVTPSTNDSNGTRPLPPVPGETQELPDKYKTDSTTGIALREQERMDSLLRQKQLTQATDLLLKVARELRTEILASSGGAVAQSESERLKLIEKLAHLIEDREKAEDQVSAALARTERTP
jgi:hypothetical protein